MAGLVSTVLALKVNAFFWKEDMAVKGKLRDHITSVKWTNALVDASV